MSPVPALKLEQALQYFRILLIIVGGLLVVSEKMPVNGGWVIFGVFALSMIATALIRHKFDIREHTNG